MPSLSSTLHEHNLVFDGSGRLRKRSSATTAGRKSLAYGSHSPNPPSSAKPQASKSASPFHPHHSHHRSGHGPESPTVDSGVTFFGGHATPSKPGDAASGPMASTASASATAGDMLGYSSGTLATMTLHQVHQRGALMIGLCVLVIGILLGLGDPAKKAAMDAEMPLLPTMHGATAVAFAFGVALNLLSAWHAVSHERRVLSMLLVYVDAVATLSYLALATLPLYTPVDHTRGFPVRILRYVEWLLTCPTILQWTCLVNHSTGRDSMLLSVGDAAVLAFGLLASFTPPETAALSIGLSCISFAVVMYQMWNNFTRALNRTKTGKLESASLPPAALELIRWEILLFWTIFPLVEIARQTGIMSYSTAEGLTCVADYAAKVGLGIIMVNCSLEQMSMMIVEVLTKEAKRTETLLYSILPKVRRGNGGGGGGEGEGETKLGGAGDRKGRAVEKVRANVCRQRMVRPSH